MKPELLAEQLPAVSPSHFRTGDEVSCCLGTLAVRPAACRPVETSFVLPVRRSEVHGPVLLCQ